MTVFHLVRHASHIHQGQVMVGRAGDVPLSDKGRIEAAETAGRLAREPVDAILTSPRRRALESAAQIAAATGAPVQVEAGLDELDFGAWTGLTPQALEADPRWLHWNAHRSAGCCPGGESMRDVWARVSSVLDRLAEQSSSATFVLVSHAEPIRAAVLTALGRSFDDFIQFDIPTGGIATLVRRGGSLSLLPAAEKISA